MAINKGTQPLLKPPLPKVKFETDNTPLGLALNREQAVRLLQALEKLGDKDDIIHKTLKDNLIFIVTIWDRRIKNAKIMKEIKK